MESKLPEDLMSPNKVRNLLRREIVEGLNIGFAGSWTSRASEVYVKGRLVRLQNPQRFHDPLFTVHTPKCFANAPQAGLLWRR